MNVELQRLIERIRQRQPRLLAIGGSAGSIEALMQLLPALPADTFCSVVVVVHLPAGRDSLLPGLLEPICAVPVQEAEPWLELQTGHLYIAPADYHLSVEPGGSFSLATDEPINFARPSIDALLGSVADVYGRYAMAVLLTGANSDGAAGMEQIARAGGLTLLQDPASAQRPEMPRAALERMRPDAVLPLPGLRRVFEQLGTGALTEIKP